MKPGPQGWYRDPFARHVDRYFSAGEPTKLVRDGGRESYDPPPPGPLPEGELIPAAVPDEDNPADVRRADDHGEAKRTPLDMLGEDGSGWGGFQ